VGESASVGARVKHASLNFGQKSLCPWMLKLKIACNRFS